MSDRIHGVFAFDENYVHRQTNLASLVSDVYQKSLNNMKEVLHA